MTIEATFYILGNLTASQLARSACEALMALGRYAQVMASLALGCMYEVVVQVPFPVLFRVPFPQRGIRNGIRYYVAAWAFPIKPSILVLRTCIRNPIELKPCHPIPNAFGCFCRRVYECMRLYGGATAPAKRKQALPNTASYTPRG